MTGVLAERADAIAATAQSAAGPVMHDAIGRIRARLTEPLRVAVVGGVNVGKSTLVNALLSQVVAPTDVSECTKVVTEFRYGFPQRAEIALRDGGVQPVTLQPGGRMPGTLGIPTSDVISLRVWLTNPVLGSMTLIDTPGLNSANIEFSARTEELLRMDADTKSAAGGADVVLFVLRPSINATEIETLRAFSAGTGSAAGSALTALGVLTKADKVDARGDPWIAATRVAQTQGQRLQSDLAMVVPVLGLLAQTAETFALTEDDAEELIELAQLPEDIRETMLWDAEHLRSACPQPDVADRLLDLLDLHGIRLCLEIVDAGARGATAVQQALAARAGLVGLRQAITDTFIRRSDALKTAEAITQLTRISYRGDPDAAAAMARLRSDLEALQDEGGMHELAELREFQQCLTGALALPDDLLADIHSLLRGPSPAQRCGLDEDATAAEVSQAAAAAARRWREFENSGPGTREQAAARVFRRSYTMLVGS